MNEGDEPIRLKLGSTMRRANMDGVGSSTYEPAPIQLRGFNAKPDPASADKVEAFMRDYEAVTHETPHREQRGTKNAMIKLEPQRSSIYVNHIQSIHQGEGGGSEALKMLCDLADKHGVSLSLSAKAYGSRANLSTPDLVKWYERYGFSLDDVDTPDDAYSFDMTRRPS